MMYAEAYRKMDARKRTRLLPFISTIFRRWYYSALIEDTPLTPANIVESTNIEYNGSPDTYPVVRLRNVSKYIGLEVAMRNISVKEHPIVADLRKLIEYCSPFIDLGFNDNLKEYQALEVSMRVSLEDTLYAAYLMEIAIWMELFEKIPSIYVNRVQVVKTAAHVLSLPNEELLAEIINAAIKMSAANLDQFIALPEPVFTESFVLEMLTDPLETDDIFQCVYDTIGFSIDDLLEQDAEGDENELDAAFLSGTFMMGVFLDKYFFTPFSYYLRLIRPYFMLPFDFEQEMKYFLETYNPENSHETAFYAPCSRYTLTELGRALFNIKPNKKNFMDMAQELPFSTLSAHFFSREELFAHLPIWINQPAYDYARFFCKYTDVFALRIEIKQDSNTWLTLEVPEDFTLHRLYLEIIARFNLARNNEYSFYHDEIESPFTEYPSQKNSRRTNKNTDAALNTLDFNFKKTMILKMHNQQSVNIITGEATNPTLRFTIEVQEKKPREPGKIYPLVTQASRRLGMNC
jgi:hypothetical protein